MFQDVKKLIMYLSSSSEATAGLEPPDNDLISREKFRLYVSAIVSLIALGLSFFVILSGALDDSNKQFASGIVGAIVGYWLKD